MGRVLVISIILGGIAVGCGEDKQYGDPIDDPNARAHALAAVSNAQTMPTMMTNDTALTALNSMSGNFNLLTGAKLQAIQTNNVAQRVDASGGRVDEACVVIGTETITYDDCDFAGAIVTGDVTVSGSHVSVDLEFFTSIDEDFSQSTDVRADVDVRDDRIDGSVSFDLQIDNGPNTVVSTFDGVFDVDVEGGCAADGDLEVHAVAKANGFSTSVWAKADYGPTCEDVVVR